MSVHSQRGKLKSISRGRAQRMTANSFPHPKTVPNFNSASAGDDLGIFNNTELTYWLGRHAIGNIGEVTTTNREKILGLIRAISPAGDMGLTYAYSTQKTKNGQVHSSGITIPLSDWKMVRIANIKLTDGLMGEPKSDLESANDADNERSSTDKELVPFFESSEAVQDCVLDHGGFPAEEMFKTNKELFSVSSTYNPELTEYTTAVDRNAPNFSETEARCAQIARDIEGGQDTSAGFEEACDDEEMAFSAVVRVSQDTAGHSRPSVRKPRGSQERLNVVRSVHTKLRTPTTAAVLLAKNDNTDQSHSTIVADSVKPASPAVAVGNSDSTTEKSSEVVSNKPSNSDVKVVDSVRATTSIEEKVKKSTLDPNAPEFQPMSLQYANLAQQAPIHHPISASNAPLTVHSLTTPQGQLPVPSVQAFVATAQPHMYVPSSIHYGSQSGPAPHLLSGVSAAANLHQVRGGSLPPNVHPQQFPSSLNPQPSVLLQSQNSGMPISQLVSAQPPVVAVPNSGGRFSGTPSSVAHTHQRSESNMAPHSTAYGMPQPNMSVSTFQSPLYQLPHSMWLAGHPQMGLHLIPGAGGSSPLMVGNLPLSQTSGPPIYPAQTMLHMQPPHLSVQVQVPQSPSTTNQQSQPQQVFQTQMPFQEHPHHIQLPAYAANMLSSQATALPNYYSTPVFASANAPAAMQQGLLPLVNQGVSQHPMGGVGHPASSIDPTLLNASVTNPQYPQQPNDLLQQLATVQLIQAQLAAGQHVNTQHRAYQTIAAMVPNNNNNPSSQPH